MAASRFGSSAPDTMNRVSIPASAARAAGAVVVGGHRDLRRPAGPGCGSGERTIEPLPDPGGRPTAGRPHRPPRRSRRSRQCERSSGAPQEIHGSVSHPLPRFAPHRRRAADRVGHRDRARCFYDHLMAIATIASAARRSRHDGPFRRQRAAPADGGGGGGGHRHSAGQSAQRRRQPGELLQLLHHPVQHHRRGRGDHRGAGRAGRPAAACGSVSCAGPRPCTWASPG